MKHFFGIVIAVTMMLFGAPHFVSATTLFDTTFSNDADCGGDCFGATYQLIITDAGDLDGTTYTGEIQIAIGNYTGSMDFIASVDFKPDGNTITSATLTSAPGGTAGWVTEINEGQAATDCSGSGVGFICSRDDDTNTLAPTTDNTTYIWEWDFIMTGALDFGHLGARYNVADDSGNGQIVSISGGGEGPTGEGPTGEGPTGEGPTGEVPEPSVLLLIGSGLLILGGVSRKLAKRN